MTRTRRVGFESSAQSDALPTDVSIPDETRQQAFRARVAMARSSRILLRSASQYSGGGLLPLQTRSRSLDSLSALLASTRATRARALAREKRAGSNPDWRRARSASILPREAPAREYGSEVADEPRSSALLPTQAAALATNIASPNARIPAGSGILCFQPASSTLLDTIGEKTLRPAKYSSPEVSKCAR